MNKPNFFEGLAVALGSSLVGSVLFTVLVPAMTSGGALRLVIAALGLGYVLYLLGRAPDRVGRVTALAAWTVVAVAAWVASLPLASYSVVHLGLVWLIRSLYFHSSLLAALADMGLGGLAMAAALWAMAHTGSLFLALWCFFLVQALFVAIPPRLSPRADAHGSEAADDRFGYAHRVAEGALRKLSASR